MTSKITSVQEHVINIIFPWFDKGRLLIDELNDWRSRIYDVTEKIGHCEEPRFLGLPQKNEEF